MQKSTFGKPSLSALSLLSFCYYSLGNISLFENKTNSNFFKMNCTLVPDFLCKINNTQYNLLSIFRNAKETEAAISKAVGYSAMFKNMPPYYGDYSLLTNSILALYNN
jgi:hypothetical protein